jgi:hypothetical protein
MVGQAYLLERRAPPRSVKLAFDQVVLPAVIDTAAQAEAVAEFLTVAARRRPWQVLGIALLVGWGAGRRAAKLRRL